MRPKKYTLTAPGVTAWIPVDFKQDPCNIGLSVVITTGPATYTVEHTYDDVFNPTVTPVAYPNAGLTAQTVSKDGNYIIPIMAVRLNLAALTAGNVSLTILQGQR